MTTATLQRTTNVVVRNASGSGALIESAFPLSLGTVGVLEVEVDGETRSEWFRVCRVHRTVAGASSVVAVEFLPLAVNRRPALRETLGDGPGLPMWGMDAIPGGSSGDPGNSGGKGQAAVSVQNVDRAVFRGKIVKFPSRAGQSEVGSAVAQPLRQARDEHAEREEGDKQMTTFLSRLVRDDEGQDLIEYVLIGSFVSIAALTAATALGTNLNNWYSKVSSFVLSAGNKVP
jgi:pilus assembly protein Flp/PilA